MAAMTDGQIREIRERLKESRGLSPNIPYGQRSDDIADLLIQNAELTAERDRLALTLCQAAFSVSLVYRDYWDNNHIIYSGLLHDNKDRKACEISDGMMNMCPEFFDGEIEDGDQLIISFQKTGQRPFAERRCIYQGSHTYGPETDEQMKQRLPAPPPGQTDPAKLKDETQAQGRANAGE